VAITWKNWMRYLVGGLWNPDIGTQWPGPMGGGNDSMQPVDDVRAMQVSAVFRSIRIIAETCAALPMYGYEKLPNGDRKPLPDSDWLNQLIFEPNPDMAGDEWRETQFAAMAGWGNGYTQLGRQSEGRVALMYPYKVDRMDVERRPTQELVYRYPNPYGVPQELEKTRVLHLRGFSIDGVMGLSPLGLARQALGVTVGAERYAGSFYASGGRPSGVMTADRILTDAQREQIRKEYGGLAEGGTDKRFWLIEGPLKYQAITVSPEDMQMLQTRTFQIGEIARIFGVPLFLLMESEKSTSWGSGLEQMNLGFLTYTLRPYLQRMVITYNRRIIPVDQRSKRCVDIDERALLSLDSAALKELYSNLSTNGIMTRNEIRRAMKLPQSDAKNMDAFTTQSALTTIENLGRVPTPAASTAPAAGA
jgi:HK97 family phage portal protein